MGEKMGRGWVVQSASLALPPTGMVSAFPSRGPDGVRGTLVDAFGPNASTVVGAALRQMRTTSMERAPQPGDIPWAAPWTIA